MADDVQASPTFGRIPTLPVFFKLRGRRVVLAGGGEPAVWKAEVLCAAGAALEVLAEEPCAGLEALARGLGPDALRLTRRAWHADDLVGAAMALGAIEDDDEALRFRDAAQAAGVPVNVVDKPAMCDFQFGTLIDRSPLVVAITTDGAAPVFGQAVRARIEALLPETLRAWAEAAKDWRPRLQPDEWSFRQRRRFWEAFAERAFRFADRSPGPDDLQACRAAVQAGGNDTVGSLTLVGVGPGTLDGTTFEAVRALQSADVIVFDDDVRPELVNLGRREAVKQRNPGSGIETRLAAWIDDRRRVIWLGTGDARSCERWRVRAAGLANLPVEPQAVPGLSRCPDCGDRCRHRGPA